jgi:hypothetical protein
MKKMKKMKKMRKKKKKLKKTKTLSIIKTPSTTFYAVFKNKQTNKNEYQIVKILLNNG